MSKSINNPHDKFFKAMMAEKDIAIEFMKEFLPVEVSSIIDFNSMEAYKDGFLNEELKEIFADSVFRFNRKDDEDQKEMYISI
ncbi:MAG: Rpn family recombination-promoting nuclease/putative transposase [Saprospiraceae bacterium]